MLIGEKYFPKKNPAIYVPPCSNPKDEYVEIFDFGRHGRKCKPGVCVKMFYKGEYCGKKFLTMQQFSNRYTKKKSDSVHFDVSDEIWKEMK